MFFGAAKVFAGVLCIGLIVCPCTHAGCSVDVVIVKGRIENPPRNAIVRVHERAAGRIRRSDRGERNVQHSD